MKPIQKYPVIALLLLIAVVSSCKKDDVEPVTDDPGTSGTTTDFTLSSIAISNGELLAQYHCETTDTNGVQNSIPLSWSNVPSGTGSLAIIMEHYPNPLDSVNANCYLLLWDIDPSVTEIPYGTADDGPWFMGSNKDGDAISYTSPCSPGTIAHEYTITIYALDQTPSSLPSYSTIAVDRDVFRSAIQTVTTVGSAKLTFTASN